MSEAKQDLSIAILAGGAGRRMGRDKGMMMVGKETFLEHAVNVAMESRLRVIVVGRTMPEGWTIPNVEFIPDRYPGLGPLGGLSTALHHTSSDILLLPCDMPKLQEEHLGWLLRMERRDEAAEILLPNNNGQIEPLFAIYRLGILERIDGMLAEDERMMKRLIEISITRELPLPSELQPGLTNVNYPQDWTSL